MGNTKSGHLVIIYNNPNLSGFRLAKCRQSACDRQSCGAQQSNRMKLSEKMGIGNLFYFEEGQAFLAAGVK